MIAVAACSGPDKSVEEPPIEPFRRPAVCPVTLPNENTPPNENPSSGHHGNGELFAALHRLGVVMVGREDLEDDGSIPLMIPWWRGEDISGDFSIETERLDAPAPPARVEIPEDYGPRGFQPSVIYFPAPGCWQVTARVGNSELSIVNLVLRTDVP